MDGMISFPHADQNKVMPNSLTLKRCCWGISVSYWTFYDMNETSDYSVSRFDSFIPQYEFRGHRIMEW